MNKNVGGVKLFKTGGCTSTATGAGVTVIDIGSNGAGAPTAGAWKNDARVGTPNPLVPNECGALTQSVHVIPSGEACMQVIPGEGGGCGTDTCAKIGVRHNNSEAAYFISAPYR
ncbi:MAG: hypothetical protein M3Z36_14770 [Acidobacteriota bacterium]|nr:hypothetical protein [Acidobacteriota bacterium]